MFKKADTEFASADITVDRFVRPTVTITAHPNCVTTDNTEWQASYALTGDRDAIELDWYVDGQYYNQQTQHINGNYDIHSGNDSVILEVVAHSEHCSDTAHVALPYYFESLYLPNAFTPGLDINNLFGAVGSGVIEFEMWVFTREGLLVFHGNSIEEKWDGTHNGTPCPQATYTYRINYLRKSMPEGPQTLVGTVTLLR